MRCAERAARGRRPCEGPEVSGPLGDSILGFQKRNSNSISKAIRPSLRVLSGWRANPAQPSREALEVSGALGRSIVDFESNLQFVQNATWPSLHARLGGRAGTSIVPMRGPESEWTLRGFDPRLQKQIFNSAQQWTRPSVHVRRGGRAARGRYSSEGPEASGLFKGFESWFRHVFKSARTKRLGQATACAAPGAPGRA